MMEDANTKQSIHVPLKINNENGVLKLHAILFSGTRYHYTNMRDHEERAFIKGIQQCMEQKERGLTSCKVTVRGSEDNGTYKVKMQDTEVCLQGYYYDTFFDGAFKQDIMCGRLSSYIKTI